MANDINFIEELSNMFTQSESHQKEGKACDVMLEIADKFKHKGDLRFALK